MTVAIDSTGPLAPYRVLDLSDERGLLCGQLLADLGADVIAVEPPGGSTARGVAPFFGDHSHPDRSIYWWAYARNKRSITLDVRSPAGRDLFVRLVEGADVVIDSATPGELDRIGIDHASLSRSNPRLVHVSITPFGQSGPRAQDAASDLTVLAASGVLWLTGDEDRPPVRLSVPQGFLHAAADGAVGALIALHERARSNLGQHVDVSAQRSAALATQAAILAAPNHSAGLKRMAGGFNLGPIRIPAVWRVADGYVTMTVLFGAGFAAFTQRLMSHLLEEGACDAELVNQDWVTYANRLLSGEQPLSHYDRLMRCIADFVASRTKAELFELALKKRLLLAPIARLDEVLASPHLLAREYWCAVVHPELGRSLRYPGAFAKFGATPLVNRLRPPRVGEHNDEVLGAELGISSNRIDELRRAEVV